MTVSESDEQRALWLYGYGSLLFKPPLHHLDIHRHFKRFDGYTLGFIRRFWQSSYDNRGTPELKGRVVTIVPAEEIAKNEEFQKDVFEYELTHLSDIEKKDIMSNLDKLEEALSVCGCVYYIPPEYVKEVSEYLDFREKDGYVTQEIEFYITTAASNGGDSSIFNNCKVNERGHPAVNCTVYVGTIENESFVGPEDPIVTAKIIKAAEGDSGPNDEYLLKLAEEVKKMGFADKYLDKLEEIIVKA